MRAPELTEELKNDLKALKMRSAMDPKRFYKKNDREGPPKYFQVGWEVLSASDFPLKQLYKKPLFLRQKKKVKTKNENGYQNPDVAINHRHTF